MKVSTSKECEECERSFRPGEVVYVSWIAEDPFCSSCRSKLTLINDWETRIAEKSNKQ